MTFSPLISGTVPHYNKFHSRQSQPIIRVLQHHHAASSNAGVDRLTNPTQPASSNYIIMSTGEILGQVPEEYRAWTSGSFEADAPSVTIEVQNSGGQVNGNDSDPASWPITDAAYNAIVNLVADVAKRYGWGGVAEGNYRGHREFSQTACPGGYIWARMGNIRADANALLNGNGGITTQGTITPIELQEIDMAAEENILARLAQIVEWQEGQFREVRENDERNRNMLAGFVRDVVNAKETITPEQIDAKFAELTAANKPAGQPLFKGDASPEVYVWDGATGFRHIDQAEYLALITTGANLKELPQAIIDPVGGK